MAKRRSHGEGTIYQRSDGRWEASISLGDGRRKRMYARTQKEAREKLTAAQRDRDQGIPIVRDERQTVAHYLTSWLEAVKPTIRPASYKRYRELTTLHIIPTLGRYQLAKLTPQTVQRLYAAKLESGLSAKTVRCIHACLRQALGEAQRLGIIPHNVAALVKPPKAKPPEIHVLLPAQVAVFLDVVKGERLEALYVLALTTGMRQGEILALKWRDVDLTRSTLQVRATLHRLPGGEFVFAEPKTGRSRRRITLSATTVAALKEHRTRQLEERLAAGPIWQDNDLVFATPDGKPIDGTGAFYYQFLRLVRLAELPRIRFHDLRHTAATLLLLRGINPKIVSELLGHSTVGMTLDTYSHVLPDMQQQAATEMDNLLTQLRDIDKETLNELVHARVKSLRKGGTKGGTSR